MRDRLVDLIVKRLTESKEDLKKQFFKKHPINVSNHLILDNLLPKEIAENIYHEFPKSSQMHLLNSSGELKFKYGYVKDQSSLIQDIYFAIQHPSVINLIEEITEIKNQVSDQSRRPAVVSTLLKGHYINPHLDNSHDNDKKFYQTVNVLYYVSPNWKLENGGNYELWDESIRHRIIVPSLFNRLVIMETNQTSWHSVNPVLCDEPRCCVLNYYYSAIPPRGQEYFHSASSFWFNTCMKPRPEQKIRRAVRRVRDMLFRIT